MEDSGKKEITMESFNFILSHAPEEVRKEFGPLLLKKQIDLTRESGRVVVPDPKTRMALFERAEKKVAEREKLRKMEDDFEKAGHPTRGSESPDNFKPDPT
jgi:hypothetical protein